MINLRESCEEKQNRIIDILSKDYDIEIEMKVNVRQDTGIERFGVANE